jgi:transposase
LLLYREIDEDTWEDIRRILAKPSKEGRPHTEDRALINGIMFVLVSGSRWEDMPGEYGSYKTANRRFLDLSKSGAWGRMWGILCEKDIPFINWQYFQEHPPNLKPLRHSKLKMVILLRPIDIQARRRTKGRMRVIITARKPPYYIERPAGSGRHKGSGESEGGRVLR